MRRLRYSVAMSLDGYIADVDGGYGWIPTESTLDFEAYLAKIDAYVMGRGTWEIARGPESAAMFEGRAVYVVSTTLPPDTDPRVTVVSSDVEDFVRDLKAREGKDIWLFGGGVLFRSLLAAGLVDRVEVGVIPALLGDGIPLLPGLVDGARVEGFEGRSDRGRTDPVRLSLHSSEAFDGGIVLLKYDVLHAAP